MVAILENIDFFANIIVNFPLIPSNAVMDFFFFYLTDIGVTCLKRKI